MTTVTSIFSGRLMTVGLLAAGLLAMAALSAPATAASPASPASPGGVEVIQAQPVTPAAATTSAAAAKSAAPGAAQVQMKAAASPESVPAPAQVAPAVVPAPGAVGSATAATGATAPVTAAPGGVVPDVGGTFGANDAQFFMVLMYKETAMLPDGYRAVAILSRGTDDLKDAEACRQYLVKSKIARASWGNDPNKALDKGQVAYMICQTLGIKGGLTMRLTGPTERYCLFEAQYVGLMLGGATYQNVTGGELVSIIDRAEEYRQKEQAGQNVADEPAVVGPNVSPAAAAPVAPATSGQ